MENTNKDNKRENRRPNNNRRFNREVKEFEERVVQINRISKTVKGAVRCVSQRSSLSATRRAESAMA